MALTDMMGGDLGAALEMMIGGGGASGGGSTGEAASPFAANTFGTARGVKDNFLTKLGGILSGVGGNFSSGLAGFPAMGGGGLGQIAHGTGMLSRLFDKTGLEKEKAKEQAMNMMMMQAFFGPRAMNTQRETDDSGRTMSAFPSYRPG